jgi:hypothetical protein
MVITEVASVVPLKTVETKGGPANRFEAIFDYSVDFAKGKKVDGSFTSCRQFLQLAWEAFSGP